MKKRAFATLACLAIVGAGGLGIGGHRWTINHVERWTGRQGLGFVGCNHCHLNDTSKQPWSLPRTQHPAPTALAVSPDGTRLYVALGDSDEIAAVDASALRVIKRAPLPGTPSGLALDATGKRLFATLKGSDEVVSLDSTSLQVLERVDVGMFPVGIAWGQTKAGPRLVVANSGSDDISILTPGPLHEVGRIGAGREPFAVTFAADGSTASVANRLATARRFDAVASSELTVIDPARGRVLDRRTLESAHLSEGIASASAHGWTLVPLVKVRNLVPITQVAGGWVMSSGLAVANSQGIVAQMPLDEANDYFADPSGITVDAAGKRAYVASGGGDAVSVVDLAKLASWLEQAGPEARRDAVDDLALSPSYVVQRIPTGRNPKAIALSPDGRRLYVAEHLDDSVMAVDTELLGPVGRVRFGDGGLNDPIRRGERVFTQAKFTFQREFSCRSCHPDAHVDGLSYDFDGDGIGDNLLDNRSLQGVANTGPFKWNGKNTSLQIQCGPRFARVLMRTDPIPPSELRDLTTFLRSLPPPRTQPRKQAPTASQERGRKIFFATETPAGVPIPRSRQCQTCHRPPLFTNRLPSSIGTKGPRDSTDMFDTPHLLGVAASAPYLHDGRAKTLEELWTTYQTNDLHGVSSYMDKHQLNDLVEFLKTL